MNISGSLLLRNHATRIFMRTLGITANPIEQFDLFLRECKRANPRYEGEKDRVRFQLEKDSRLWSEEARDAIFNLAGYLNMLRGETPLTGAFDYIITMGGARRAPLDRACFAAQAILDSRASASKGIVIAGSTRLLADDEKPLIQDYAPGAETEHDLCVGACERILKRHPELKIFTVRHDNPRSGNDGVINEFMNNHNQRFSNNEPLRIAGVTTRIYTVGLHLDLARAANRYGWRDFFAAGHSSSPEMVFNRQDSTYLSECFTTLRKAAIAAAEGY